MMHREKNKSGKIEEEVQKIGKCKEGSFST